MTLQLTQVTSAKQAVAQCLAEQRSILDSMRLPLWHLTDRIALFLRGEEAETNALVRRKLFLCVTRADVGPPGPR